MNHPSWLTADLPPRIKQLIAAGVVKVMTWEQYQQWKRSKK